MTSHDKAYMRRCLELASQALPAGDVPVGALVVREGRVIGEGCERTRAHFDPTAHTDVRLIAGAAPPVVQGGVLAEPCIRLLGEHRTAGVSRR